MKKENKSYRDIKGNKQNYPTQRAAPANTNARSRKPDGHSSELNKHIIPKSWRMVVGTHAIKELLSVRPNSVKLAIIKQGWESSKELRDFHAVITRKNIKLEMRSDGNLDKLSGANQGLILFSDQLPVFDIEKVSENKKSVLLLLDGIEDPHNLGAIIRTAWLTGVHGVIVSMDRSVDLTATVHKVACGGVEHVPLVSVVNFSSLVGQLKEKGYWLYGLSPNAHAGLYQLSLPQKVIWVIGSEQKGMRTTTERLCDELIKIPQVTQGASFNASVAAAITLSETVRQLFHLQE